MPAYSKTTWIDGSAPAIDATNLNKMEQGIFDAFRQDGSTTMSGQLVTTAGSAATPAIAPTGDANTGIFFPAADTIAFGEGGAEAMRINSSGNVGIGMDSNGAKLALNGNMSLSSASFSLGYNIESNTGSISGVNSPFYGLNMGVFTGFSAQGVGLHGYYGQIFSTSGTERMRITSAGNVGIGTTSPNGKLQVGSSSDTSTYKIFIEGSNTADTKAVFVSSAKTSRHFGIHTSTDNFFIGRDSVNSDFTISSTGNVGIGTTSPSSTLHISSATASFSPSFRIINTGTANDQQSTMALSTDNSTSNSFLIGKNSVANGADTFLSNQANSAMIFETNGTARMRITSAGNVGIGITTPQNILHVADMALFSKFNNGPNELNGAYIGNDGTYPTIDMRRWTGVSTNHGTAKIRTLDTADMCFYVDQKSTNTTATTERMRMTAAGYLLIGYTSSNGAYPLQVNGQIFATSSTIATSDGRYKKDVVALDGALDIVKALNPVQFSWKDHPVHKFNTDVPTVGFIAQEVQQVLADKSYLTSIIKKSECTWETETGEFVDREVTRDVEKQVEREITEEIDGEEVTRTVTETVIEQVTEIVQEPVKETHTEEFLGIAESNLIAILTKAVKELTAKVEALEAQLNK